MPGRVFLHGDGVELRTVEREDLDFLRACRNDPAVRTSLPVAVPRNGHAHEQEFEERFSSDDTVTLLVTDPADVGRNASGQDATDRDAPGRDAADRDAAGSDGPEPRGFVALFRIEPVHGVAALGAWVAPDHWGEGYATAAAHCLVEYAFAERRLERLNANALATNDASRAVLETVGFVEEGRKRESRYVLGERVDLVNYGLLRHEWAERDDPVAAPE